ncbi:MAG: UDP-N-acetylmuramoyl-tripeptide--D-alanyl-D-alanine ligase [Firmicutes bacterium]|nr:UDP-N-acetylmuramoyl-tripeptide--D-alanyl-D-alanine ligase [Bacillota bacterium]
MTFNSTAMLVTAILVSIINAGLLCVVAYKPMQIFQQCGYKVYRYVDWMIGNRKHSFLVRLFILTFITFAGMAMLNILTYRNTDIPYLALLGLLFYLGISVLFCIIVLEKKSKIPLKYTPRIKRQYIVIFILSGFLTYLLLWLGNEIIGHWLYFSLIALTPFLLPYIIIATKYILFPIEFAIRTHFIRIARNKLHQPAYSHVVRVGITGSYGKTSCKNILARMLEEKFFKEENTQRISQVASSPASFNTPLGFAKTVNEVLLPHHKIMVFEMGLRYKRDIKILAGLFRPQHGILTAIGSQHIETMGSLEAIKAEKAELINAIPENGIAVLNGNSPRCVEVFNESNLVNKCLTKVISSPDANLPQFSTTATNISVSKDGCKFTLNLDNKSVECTSKLLGAHNIENILMCATMAYKLGVSLGQIAIAVADLKPTSHRLELVEGPTGIIILDDSYNASEQGTRAALNVLSLFDGKKVVQTPGIVEQGKQSYQTNFAYAKEIAKIADAVIVINETNKQAILDGLETENFDKEQIYTVANLDQAKELYGQLLKPGDCLLIANDLPDNFN